MEVPVVGEAAMGIGKTRTAPGMSSGLIGVLLSVEVSRRDKSPVVGLEAAVAVSSADEEGVSPPFDEIFLVPGCGVVIISSKRRALRFTEINSFFSVFVVIVVVLLLDIFADFRGVSIILTGGVD